MRYSRHGIDREWVSVESQEGAADGSMVCHDLSGIAQHFRPGNDLWWIGESFF